MAKSLTIQKLNRINNITYEVFWCHLALVTQDHMASSYIPAPLEDARFRKSERFIIRAHFFIKGYSGEYVPEQPFYSINALLKGVSNSS